MKQTKINWRENAEQLRETLKDSLSRGIREMVGEVPPEVREVYGESSRCRPGSHMDSFSL
jgi:hypothetical protein